MLNKIHTACRWFKDEYKAGTFIAAEDAFNVWLKANRGAVLLQVAPHCDVDSGGSSYHSIFVVYRHKERIAKNKEVVKLPKKSMKGFRLS